MVYKLSIDFMKVNKDDGIMMKLMELVHNSCNLYVCGRHVQSAFSSKYTLECDRKSKVKARWEPNHNNFITTLRKDYV